MQANVTQAWGQLEAAKAQIDAAQSQVTAAEVALNGVREDARVGQRTTLDVFNAQAGSRQRPRVVASYTVLAATGARSHRKSSGSRSRSTSGSLPAGA